MRPPGPLEIGLLIVLVIVGLAIWVLVHFIRKHWYFCSHVNEEVLCFVEIVVRN